MSLGSCSRDPIRSLVIAERREFVLCYNYFPTYSEPVSYAAAVEEGDTSGLVIEDFDDLNKVGADVVLLHGCPQSCMPNAV